MECVYFSKLVPTRTSAGLSSGRNSSHSVVASFTVSLEVDPASDELSVAVASVSPPTLSSSLKGNSYEPSEFSPSLAVGASFAGGFKNLPDLVTSGQKRLGSQH